MAYGILKVDTITFTDAGVDKSVTISGLVQNPTFSGNITVTGTVSGNTIQGQTVSGVTVTGGAAAFTTVTGGVATITSGVFALGSASNPSISFTGDANSGLYSPGADQVAISTGGSGRLFVDANGNIAIGTSATSNFGATARSFDINSAGGIANLYVKTGTVNGGLQADAGNGYMQVWTASNHPIAFNIAFSEKMRLDTSGRLGIGTSAPGSYWAGVDNLVIADSGDAGLAIKSGTGNYGTIAFTDTVSTTNEGYIQYDHNLNSLKFGTNSTNALFIDSSQRVGIGTTSVQSPLDVTATGISGTTTNDGIRIYAANRSQYANFGYDGFNTTFSSLKFAIADAERARIDSSGRLLVGTSSTSQLFSGVALTGVQIEKSGNSATRSLALVSNASVNFPPTLSLCRSQGTSNGSVTSVASGDNLGTIRWGGADGTTAFIDAASITCEVDGTPGTNDMPGRLVFSTTADGASSPTERLRITSAGLVGIGTSSPSKKLQVDSADFDTALFKRTNSTGSATIFLSNTSNHGAAIQSLGNGVGGFAIFTQTSNVITERLRIDSSGRVGIGTTSPSGILTVKVGDDDGNVNSWNSNYFLVAGGDTATSHALGFGVNTANNYSFITSLQPSTAWKTLKYKALDHVFEGANDAERARIDSSGRLGIGTSSPDAKLETVDTASSLTYPLAVSNFTDPATDVGAAVAFHLTTGGNSRGYIACRYTSNSAAGGTYLSFAPNDGSTGNVERMRITTAGRVGIGVNAPSYLLDLLGSAPRIRVKDSSTGAAFHHFENNSGNFYLGIDNSTGGALSAGNYARVLWSQGAYPLVFATNDTQRAQIDASGRLLVGTSTARANFYNATISALFQQEGATSSGDPASRFMSLTYGKGNIDSGVFVFAKHRATTVGGQTVVVNGDRLGELNFQGSDGTEFVQAASIRAEVDGTPGANDMPGRLVFSTTADGASTPTEHMRIKASGEIAIGEGGVNTSYMSIRSDNAAVGPLQLNKPTTTGKLISFYSSSSFRGDITTNGSTVAYNTSSDYRLKENVTPVSDGITRLQQLKPSRFNFIADPDKTVDGFLAHEAAEVVPECVTGEKDAVDDEGNPVYQGIDQSKLVPLLTAALQEAVAKIESLEARLTAAGI
jgi:hypothetical protein